MANAGWYPDPDVQGGQRYFDGTNWGPSMPPTAAPTQTPPQKHAGNNGRIWAVVVGLLVVLFVIGKCSSSGDDKESNSSSSSSGSRTTSAVATASPTPTGPVKPDATFTTGQGPQGLEVTARFAIGDNFTEGMIKDGARFDTIDILEYSKLTYPTAGSVNIQGSFPMKDAYGNTSTDVVVNITYLKSTLDQINFEGVDKDRIWELRDSGFVHPEFQP